MRWARVTHRALCWLIMAGLVLQFYAAGLAAFGAADFTLHGIVGWSLILATILLMVFALLGGYRRGELLQSLVLLPLVILQPVLALVEVFRVSAPAVAAIHPVNGLLIFLLLTNVIRCARGSRRVDSTDVTSAA